MKQSVTFDSSIQKHMKNKLSTLNQKLEFNEKLSIFIECFLGSIVITAVIILFI